MKSHGHIPTLPTHPAQHCMTHLKRKGPGFSALVLTCGSYHTLAESLTQCKPQLTFLKSHTHTQTTGFHYAPGLDLGFACSF